MGCLSITFLNYYSELNKTESDENIEADDSHHSLLVRVLADEMGIKRKYSFL